VTPSDPSSNTEPFDPQLGENSAGSRRSGFSLAKVAGLCVATLLLGGGIGSTLQKARLESSTKQTNDQPSSVDIGFLRDMMVHHEQAIELSAIVMDRGTDTAVGQEALDILLAQRGEYVQMSDQLDRWGVDPLPENDTSMAWMGMAVPTAKMPGLASPEQIANLKTLKGIDADIEFLRLMINHHASGADMAKFASDRTEIAFVGVMAGRMAAVQTTEIAEMRSFGRRLGVEIAAPKPMDHSSMDTDSATSDGGKSDESKSDESKSDGGTSSDTLVDHSTMDHG
jgi:uncharacterized protein (DUF305 family)